MGTLLQIGECRDNISDVVRELCQASDDRLCFPPTEILERYMGNRLAVLIDLSCEVGGKRTTFAIQMTHDLHSNMAGEIYNLAGGVENNQFAMFIGNIHAVNDKKQIVRRINSAVRLQFFDELECGGLPHSLYLSVISGEFIFKRWRRFKYGKFEIPMVGRLADSVVGQLPDNMIQARSEMMDHFACEDTKAQRDRQRFVILNSLQKLLVAELRQDGIFAVLKEPGDFRLEINDVLVGPF